MNTATLGVQAPSAGLPRFLSPPVLLPWTLAILLALCVLAPLVRIAWLTVVGEDGLGVWQEVVAGRISRNLLWRPLGNTLIIGVATVLGTLLIGGVLAWLVVMTDVPLRRFIAALAALPFVVPSFASAFAWGVVFRNPRAGGETGWLEQWGLSVPDWLAWGLTPTIIVLILHYASLVFMLVSAALASVHADMVEAAHMTGASRARILAGIILPVVSPAIISASSLVFAGAVSNFAAPALLGLPVNSHTLSTRLYGMISTGSVERGYVLALILILISALVLWYATRAVSGRKSFATLTGKGGRTQRFTLGAWRWPLAGLGVSLGLIATVIPLLVLLLSSLTREAGNLGSGLTLHYWFGPGGTEIAQGVGGVLRDPELLRTFGITIALGLVVAFLSLQIGLLTAYVTTRYKNNWLVRPLATIAFLPSMVPGIAFGAAFIALFSQSWGPIPSLYGTFTLLVIAGVAYTLPFSVQSARAALAQVSGDIEDAATIAGASLPRRLLAIYLPLTMRSLLAGGVLVVVKMIRDLSLVMLLFTPAMPVLSVVAYRYASEGFLQHANAITMLITLISVGATLIAEKLKNASQPWMKD